MDALSRVLQTESLERFEETIAVSRDFYDACDYSVLDDVQDDFYAKYREAVKLLSTTLGKPRFDDGMANPRFPRWYEEALFLAFWLVGQSVVYVALRHDDKELPFMLVVGRDGRIGV